MGRGLVLGRITSPGLISGVNPVDCTVRLQSIVGCDTSTGSYLRFQVPYIETAGLGGYTTSGPDRPTLDGAFAIPFYWDSDDPDNFVRATGNGPGDTNRGPLRVRVTATKSDYTTKSFDMDQGWCVPDALELSSWIAQGKLAAGGDGLEIAKYFGPEMKKAAANEPFKGVPFLLGSNHVVMIIGLLPSLSW